ncbi:MAG: RdgB/HAM1 family non-canonical purine NTP pyrophosphatase [Minicystis sp.]
MSPLFTLLLATTNKGKLAELGRLLGDLPVELVSLGTALPGRPQAVEDGATLEDNAWIKGRAAASASMLVTLAEDSGLEVDALGGRPGVRSARFAGEGATDAENNAALIAALNEIDDDQRGARFRCVMVLIDPFAEGEAREQKSEGRCEGEITREPRGAGGFGYDPLFVVADKARTMAELDEQEKGEVSHRGRAALAMRPALEALIARRLAETARIAGG